jgi:hypothetical protein
MERERDRDEQGNALVIVIRVTPLPGLEKASRKKKHGYHSPKNLREDEEVVGGGNGDRVLVRMPRRVQDLLGEINRLDIDIVLLAVLGPCHHLVLGRTHSLGLERALIRLKSHIVLAITVVNVKIVVVRSRQHIAIIIKKGQVSKEKKSISGCMAYICHFKSAW